ncbi:MAG: ribosome small subunit-dependent GTPase A [Bulleidia sp.]|nr:ribosome small subunit-dependent GTPase A [Bulleidia sp.]
MKAQIIKIVSKEYTLYTEEKEIVKAVLTGKIRKQVTPVVGDYVQAEKLHEQWTVQKILERSSYMQRPAIANVNQALIIMSCKDPDFSSALVDRISILVKKAGITPILVVTKCDMGMDGYIQESVEEYQNGPMRVILTGKDRNCEELEEVLKGKVSVLTGQSGAGKSSLLNRLDPTFQLATQEISKALGRGKHTTRHTELHFVCGGLVADTPGFSSLDFSNISKQELGQCMVDFESYIGQCRFNDCIHQNEPGCAIKQAVEEKKIPLRRYRNYLDVLEIIQQRKEKYL